jgi:hypothetical protein
MPYQIGSAPPGLRGFLMSRQNQQVEQQQQMQAVQQMIGLQGLLQKQQMAPLEMELMRAKVDAAKQKSELPKLIEGYFNGGNGTPSDPQDRATAQLAAIERIAVLDPPRARALLEAWKASNPELKYEGGIGLHPRTGLPKPGAPIIPQTNPQGFSTTKNVGPDGQISVGVTPGAAQAYGAQQGISEETKAKYDLVDVPLSDGRTVKMPRAEAVKRVGQQYAASAPVAPVAPPAALSGLEGRPQAEQDAIRSVYAANQRGQGASVEVPAPSAIPSSAVLGATPTPGYSAADKEVGQGDAKRVLSLEEKIPNLNSTLARLGRLERLSADGTYSAAGAEIKLQLNSIAQAMGLKIDTKKAANTEEYIAHVYELLKERLGSKDFGSGSGVSNVDLVAAGKPLPEVMRTPQGRAQIIQALRKDVQRSLLDAQAARQHFRARRSLDGFRFPSEINAQIEGAKPGPQAAPVNDPLGLFK